MKLDGRAGKAFDAMRAGGMNECFSRTIRTEPPDVDSKAIACGTPGGQSQCMEPTARFLNLGAKPRPCFLVVLGKV